MRRNTIIAVAVSFALLLSGGGLAYAAWSSAGPGTATSRAGILSPPSAGNLGSPSCTSATTATLPISFSAASAASGYIAQWSDSSTFTNPTSTTTSSTTPTLTITGATTTKTIYVRILSTAGAWQSGPSPVASAQVGPCQPACTPGSLSVNASADAWIDEANPNTNHGNDSRLSVTSSVSGDQRALVQFALPPLPTGCTLNTATLQLRREAGTPGRTILVGRNTQAWSANSVTNANRPPVSTTDAGTSTTPASSPSTQQWTVTAIVRDQYAGPNYGFVVRDQTENSSTAATQTYSSMEGTRRPSLVITYN